MNDLYLDLEWSKKLQAKGVEVKSKRYYVTYESYKYALKDSLISKRRLMEILLDYEGLDDIGKKYTRTDVRPAPTLEELLAQVDGSVLIDMAKKELLASRIYDFSETEKRLERKCFYGDIKICVAELLLWQRGEGR